MGLFGVVHLSVRTGIYFVDGQIPELTDELFKASGMFLFFVGLPDSRDYGGEPIITGLLKGRIKKCKFLFFLIQFINQFLDLVQFFFGWSLVTQ